MTKTNPTIKETGQDRIINFVFQTEYACFWIDHISGESPMRVPFWTRKINLIGLNILVETLCSGTGLIVYENDYEDDYYYWYRGDNDDPTLKRITLSRKHFIVDYNVFPELESLRQKVGVELYWENKPRMESP